MDMNLVVLSGRLAAQPEARSFETSATLIRVLVTVTSDTPTKRLDVLPVTLWNADNTHEVFQAPIGTKIWVTGSMQRRFWEDPANGRRSRLEIVASAIVVREDRVNHATA